MRVFLPRIRTGPFTDLRVDDFERLAAVDRFGCHLVTRDPAEADIILFTQCHMVDWRLRAIRDHPVARQYWEKVMVYDERDRPWLSFPGVYVGSPASLFDDESQRAWGYIETLGVSNSSVEPDLLFSFVGSDTARCRRPLFDIRHPDGIIEKVQDFTPWYVDAPKFERRRNRYREVLARSRFVLCPRGRGTASFRLFETLAAGRVPVILSDEWVAPYGQDWESCSIRWPEGRNEGLVEMLEERARDWPAMSVAAARAHQRFFAADVSFHRVIDLCRSLRDAGFESAAPLRVRNRPICAVVRERTSRTA